MVARFKHILIAVAATLVLGSCSDSKPGGKGPIVLGDSSTIVNEGDEQQLKDLVTDLQPVIPPSENKDEAEQPAKDTTKPVAVGKPPKPQAPEQKQQQPVQPQALSNAPGLKAEFKEVTVMIPGLVAKQGGNPNLQRANGAVYTYTSGNINGATIRATGLITKVSQRYQSIVVMKGEDGDLVLDALSVTSGWEQMKGGNGAYAINGLDPKSLKFYDADNEDIRNAVQKAARRHRYSRRKTQELLSDVKRLKAANQKPLSVVLRSVMWKIDGKDEQGRLFSKQIRVDIPL